MYRYVFNPYSCRWEIQLLKCGFIWRTLRAVDFETLATAKSFAEVRGIPDLYQEQRPFNHTPVTAEQEIPQ